MIILNNIGKNIKGKIWIDELPDIIFNGDTTTKNEIKTSCKSLWDERSIVLELCLPRNNSNYALLGVEYYPIRKDEIIEVQIEVSKKKTVIYNSSIAMAIEKTYVGILPEYAEAINKTLSNYLVSCECVPSGKLIFRIGAHGEIGSSKGLFSMMTKVVILLLTKNLTDIKNEEIQKLVKEAIKSN